MFKKIWNIIAKLWRKADRLPDVDNLLEYISNMPMLTQQDIDEIYLALDNLTNRISGVNERLMKLEHQLQGPESEMAQLMKLLEGADDVKIGGTSND